MAKDVGSSPFAARRKPRRSPKMWTAFCAFAPAACHRQGSTSNMWQVVLGEEKGEHDAENIKNVELNKIWNIWGKTHIYRYIDAILKDAAVTHSWTLVVLTIQNHSLKNGLYKSRGAESTCELDDQDVRCLPSELSFFFGLNQRETVLLETYKASGSLHFQVMWPLWCTNKTASCEQSYAGDVHIGKLKLQFFWWHNPVIDGP